MSNRLANSTSPYLLQHKDNPVDWWEWSDEAFEEARRRDVPVFVSIGYSSCHWCHVMAHESFEDPALAAFLNEHFVSIKVDREERPDIDSIYMGATVAMTGQGGWPMSVFVDHEARPFFAGTYFPPEPRRGLPSFRQLTEAISDTWRTRRADVGDAAQRITDALAAHAGASANPSAIDEQVLTAALAALESEFDPHHGGFGGAPKFPPSMLLEFCLREAARTGNARALAIAEATFEEMARGGLNDQLGGGFARYSVDAAWVVPHFEKMLYDNALLLRAYAHWWRLTGSPLAERVVRSTAGFLLAELRTPEGGFAAALDADSEGVEGRFYAWSPAQLAAVLGEQDGAWAAEVLDVTAAGTFDHGLSTLQLRADPADWERWLSVRDRLLAARSQRVRPGRDDKVVAAWNGLAIAALAEAGALLGEQAWVDAAVGAADLLVAVHLVDEPLPRLRRVSRDGHAGRSAGVLDDYASVAEGFLALAQVTGEDSWLTLAGTLLDVAVRHFSSDDGGFFTTADEAEGLVVRPREISDNAEPSGWSAMAAALLGYAALTGSHDHRERAVAALGPLAGLAVRSPRATGWALAACSALLDGPAEITVNGDAGSALHRVALMATAPGAVVIVRPTEQVATAMVCRHHVCSLQTTDAEALGRQVGARPLA